MSLNSVDIFLIKTLVGRLAYCQWVSLPVCSLLVFVVFLSFVFLHFMQFTGTFLKFSDGSCEKVIAVIYM